MVLAKTFQLTPSRKATRKNNSLFRSCIFQLTPSRKATNINHVVNNLLDFNSRLHGRRQQCFGIFVDSVVFQLTPSRKATFMLFNNNVHGIFQLTPSRKATSSATSSLHSMTVYFNSRLHGRRLQIQIIFAAKHFLFLLILSKFLILAFLFHLASLRFSLHPVIFPVRISLYFSVYLPFALETCTLCHNI